MSLPRRCLTVALTLAATSALVFALPSRFESQAKAQAPSASVQDKYAGLSTVAPLTIENPGFPPAYYYKPRSGRKMKPVLVYLHGRDGNPEEGCRQWAKVATEFGWLLCPSGQEARAGGGRGWANDPINSQKNVMGALAELRKKFGRKVQLYGNVIMGFSEGAFVAQNIGEHETKTFNRWLIVASCDRYFGYDKTVLETAKKKVKRVYLWTGETDGVVAESQQAYEHLKGMGISVKLNVAKGYGHQIPIDTMGQQYRKAIRWLVAAK
jgi:predicted esterase